MLKTRRFKERTTESQRMQRIEIENLVRDTFVAKAQEAYSAVAERYGVPIKISAERRQPAGFLGFLWDLGICVGAEYEASILVGEGDTFRPAACEASPDEIYKILKGRYKMQFSNI